MEGRCAVETWAQFGVSGPPGALKVIFGCGVDALICTGSCEVYIFNTQENKLRAVLQVPEVVSDLAESQSQQTLYVSCSSGVYVVDHLLLNRTKSSTVETSPPPELKVSAESLIDGADGGSSLLVTDALLVTLCQRNSLWRLTLFKTPKQTDISGYERLCSVTLPTVSDAVQGVSESGLKRSSDLICVHCGDAAPSSKVTSGGFCLEPILFKLLFGVDAALSKSPVVLCGLTDGRVCFLPLKTTGPKLQVLHSLEQRVVFVGVCALEESPLGCATCLVAVGEQGRVVLIKTDKARQEGGGVRISFIESCVPGPVSCCCMEKNSLYYSIGSDLLELDLSKAASRGGGGDSSSDAFCQITAAIQSPVSLNVCRVIALAPCHTAGKVQLLGLSLRGQLLRISPPVSGEDADVPTSSSNRVSHSVRDFLSAIGDVFERAASLKTVIKSKNQTLKRLNQVLNICFLLLESTSEQSFNVKEKPIRCHASTHWTRLLQTDSLNLTCVLVNSSPYVLERGWTLSVIVFALSHSPTAGGQSPATHFSFPISRLSSGEMLEVSLPLSAAEEANFPMTVSCSLIFSASDLLADEDAASFPRLEGCCTSLHLNTLTVDWLHTLQVNNDTQKKGAPPPISSTATVQGFINSRRQRHSRNVEQGESTVRQNTHSAKVRVSSELLKNSVVLTTFNLDTTVQTSDHQNICVCLIDWLLSAECGGVNSGHKEDRGSFNSAAVHARAPNGARLRLTAKEVKVEEESLGRDEPLNVTEVQVESSSMAAVCGIHHAVLRRIQTLLLTARLRTTPLNLQTLGIRQALRRAEILQSQIWDVLSAVTSPGTTDPRLLSVYRELRENPLLIL